MENSSRQRMRSPEEEIFELKQRIKELERTAEAGGGRSGEGISNPIAAAREAVKKHSESSLDSSTQRAADKEARKIKEQEGGEAHHFYKIKELLQIAQEKGVAYAIEVAKKIEDPHLEDDFHDSLARFILTHPEKKEKGWFWQKKRARKILEFILYEVSFPYSSKRDTNEGEGFKDIIQRMEQFYFGMSDIEPYFALEIGIPFDQEEVIFFCSVPLEKAQLFEKNLQGLYPEANLSIRPQDYNIFKPDGAFAGSRVFLEKTSFLPIKTYDDFEVDPLQVILNSFTKLEREGEGAAFQLIILPQGVGSFNKAVKKTLSSIREGKMKPENLTARPGKGFLGAFLKEMSAFLGKSKDEKEKNAFGSQNSYDEEFVKLLEKKASAPMMAANLRILVSTSKGPQRAEAILNEIQNAFAQFREVHGNSFVFKRAKGKKLKKLVHQFSFRLPERGKSVVLNFKELAALFHFPLGMEDISAPHLKRAMVKESAPPLNLPQEGILLGKNVFRGEEREVRMTDDDRRRHFYIIGQTGTGKTALMKNMIAQDIKNGKGLCFIDPHGSDIQDILSLIPPEREDDLIYFDPSNTRLPMGLNMLEYDPNYPEQKTFVVNELLGIFKKLYGAVPESMGPAFEQYFRNATLLVMDDPQSGNTLLEVQRVFADKNFRNYKLSRSTNPVVRTFWKDIAEKTTGEQTLANFAQYVTNKFDTFLTNEIMRPIIAQEKSAFNFRQIMDEGKILLVNLSKGRLGDLNSNLLGLIIVGKLLMASLSRVDMPEEERRDFYLYIDEFQNVTTDSIATILSEARKYRLDLIIAHQFIGQLEENIKKAVFGNVGSMAAFRVGAEDAEVLEKQFEPVFSAYDLINISNYNAYLKLLINGQVARPFNMRTLPFEKGEISRAREMAEKSAQKYGRPREEIEKEIQEKYNEL